MTPIEIFALIVAAIVLIKTLVVVSYPKKWMNVVDVVWKNPNLILTVSTVLAAVVLFYLLKTISIVEIFAVILFVMLISVSTVSVYSRDIRALARKMLKDKKIVRKFWAAILIWVLLCIWVLISIF